MGVYLVFRGEKHRSKEDGGCLSLFIYSSLRAGAHRSLALTGGIPDGSLNFS